MPADQFQIKQITRKTQPNALLSRKSHIHATHSYIWHAGVTMMMVGHFWAYYTVRLPYFFISLNEWRQNQISTATNTLAIIFGFIMYTPYQTLTMSHTNAWLFACCKEENQLKIAVAAASIATTLK